LPLIDERELLYFKVYLAMIKHTLSP